MTGHHAGSATYPGDVESIVGELHGPTTYGTRVVATRASYNPDTDRTRVDFTHYRPGVDHLVRNSDGTLAVSGVGAPQ